ncbi:hypothetical protein [Saccharothrix xinjiangensis]|uniref:Uncharacterized protein n=1 Tax=Saccharothrix xinjiangensis TaxID=204798 RepID=A0ABV9XV85_9PSEU
MAAVVTARRREVPRAPSRWVRRRSYLDTVLRISRGEDVERLDAFVPNLRPAGHDEALRDLQVEWQRINGELGVRLVTGQHHHCLRAGAELLGRGVAVRVVPGPVGDDLSYHVFTRRRHCTALNHRDGDRDRPNRLDGTPTGRPPRPPEDRRAAYRARTVTRSRCASAPGPRRPCAPCRRRRRGAPRRPRSPRAGP